MAARPSHPYPPCISGQCTNPQCCAQGHKFKWPELLGKTEAEAKAVIRSDNPLVTVVSVTPGRVGFADFCCNRVYLVINTSNKVTNIPQIGELKLSWPELVGQPGAEAKAIIEKENPNVTAIIVHPRTYTFFDFCCNRVWVKVDDKNNVRQVPHVG